MIVLPHSIASVDVLTASANVTPLQYLASRRREFGYPSDPAISSSLGDVHGTHPERRRFCETAIIRIATDYLNNP